MAVNLLSGLTKRLTSIGSLKATFLAFSATSKLIEPSETKSLIIILSPLLWSTEISDRVYSAGCEESAKAFFVKSLTIFKLSEVKISLFLGATKIKILSFLV